MFNKVNMSTLLSFLQQQSQVFFVYNNTASREGCVVPPCVMTVLMENKTGSLGSVMVRLAITESLNSSWLTRSPAPL